MSLEEKAVGEGECVRFLFSMSVCHREREGGRIKIGLGAVNDCKNEILTDLLKEKKHLIYL